MFQKRLPPLFQETGADDSRSAWACHLASTRYFRARPETAREPGKTNRGRKRRNDPSGSEAPAAWRGLRANRGSSELPCVYKKDVPHSGSPVFAKITIQRRECAPTYKISRSKRYKACSDVVRAWGLEPQRIAAREPKSRMSANFIMPACMNRRRIPGSYFFFLGAGSSSYIASNSFAKNARSSTRSTSSIAFAPS